jgi:hypothetical protein
MTTPTLSGKANGLPARKRLNWRVLGPARGRAV